jgi:deoxyribonuclease V
MDVDYHDREAAVACVLFNGWRDGAPAREIVDRLDNVEPYEPGQFYKRELPCLLAALNAVREPLEAVLVDGYVWLHEDFAPGLGARLYEALGRRIPVIGVAKTLFVEAASIAVPVVRGTSARPLYVTAAGMPQGEAADHIRTMHGGHRLPTLLKRVDRLCREAW